MTTIKETSGESAIPLVPPSDGKTAKVTQGGRGDIHKDTLSPASIANSPKALNAVPSNSDQPDVPAYKEGPPDTEVTSNPYFSSPNLMAAIFNAMREYMDRNATLVTREATRQIEMTSLEYDSAMATAEMRKSSAENEAFQTLTSAVGSAVQGTAAVVQLGDLARSNVKAQEKYKTEVTGLKDKTAQAEAKLGALVGTQAGTDPAVIQNNKQLIDNVVKKPDTAPDYATNQVKVDAAVKEVELARKAEQQAVEGEYNRVSTYSQEFQAQNRIIGEIVKSSVDALTGGVTTGLKVEKSTIDYLASQSEAELQTLRSAKQTSEQSLQSARSAVDDAKRTLEQQSQQYSSQMSSHA